MTVKRKTAEPANASQATFRKRLFRVPRREIGYLRFILEAYDGLAFLRTLDGRAGLVEIAWAPSREAEATELVTALAEEMEMAEVTAEVRSDPF